MVIINESPGKQDLLQVSLSMPSPHLKQFIAYLPFAGPIEKCLCLQSAYEDFSSFRARRTSLFPTLAIFLLFFQRYRLRMVPYFSMSMQETWMSRNPSNILELNWCHFHRGSRAGLEFSETSRDEKPQPPPKKATNKPESRQLLSLFQAPD